MPSTGRVRVVVAVERRPVEPWQQALVDAARAVPGVDVELVAAAAMAPASTLGAIDVVVDLAESPAQIAARFGTWCYTFGDGAPLAEGAPGTVVRLCRKTADQDRVIVLHEGWYRARTVHGWGTASVLDRVAPWCARVLRQIVAGEAGLFEGPARSTAGCTLTRPPRHPGPPGGAVGDTLRSWLTRQRWTVGLIGCGVEDILQRGHLPTPAWLVGQPPDRFYADPFLLRVDGDDVRLLVEEYRYPSRAKTLGELRVGRDGALRESRARTDLPTHASYPFLLRDKGGLFCVPETHRARRVSAYASDSAGGTWSFHRDLMSSFPFVDSTLLEHEGKWWLFCTKQGDEDQTELHVFHADAWDREWCAHALNPVKADTRSSRPAGACFTIDGVLYRPAQNCARWYGAGITINRLVELTPTRFREEAALSLGPPPGRWPDGVHTINSLNGLTVIDGLRVERRLGPAAWQA